MASKYPYYQMWVDDFDDDEKVLAMGLSEVGLYLLCLNRSWVYGSLPDNAEEVAVLVRRKASDVRKAWAKVRACYIDRGDGRLVNRKQEEIREKATGKSNKAKNAVETRWERKRREALGCDTDVQRTYEERIENVIPRAYDSDSDSSGALVVFPNKPVLAKTRFQPNCEQFKAQYPRAIDDEDMRHFISYIETPADEATFFRILAVNAATWESGFIPKAENYLRKGTWKAEPKAASVKARKTGLDDTLAWLATRGEA